MLSLRNPDLSGPAKEFRDVPPEQLLENQGWEREGCRFESCRLQVCKFCVISVVGYNTTNGEKVRRLQVTRL